MSLQPYRDPNPSPWMIPTLGLINRHLVLPWVARLDAVDLPRTDLERLKAVVNPRTVAFLAPSHPEFMTDWMIDREIACRVSPGMVSWAAQNIVNASPLAQRFWRANGLIANTPGGGGKAFSLRKALEGHGVLLHPEGGVSWQAEQVGPLHPGAVDMVMQLADTLHNDERPVYIVPLVWRMAFVGDATMGLLAEMAHIERACDLSPWPSSLPADRLASLLGSLLARRAHSLGLNRPRVDPLQPGHRYFDAQAGVLAELRTRFTEQYGTIGDDTLHALRNIQRGIRRRANSDPEGAARDQQLLLEFHRLSRLDESLYGRPHITHEQIAEILKSTRQMLVTSGFWNTLHNLIPRGVARRVAHVRVPEPIDVKALKAAGTNAAAMQSLLHQRLQTAVDSLGTDLDASMRRFRMWNPMAVRNCYASEVPQWRWNNRAS